MSTSSPIIVDTRAAGDRSCADVTTEAFLALRPEARLEIFDNARLLPNDEYAERFNRLAADFLATE